MASRRFILFLAAIFPALAAPAKASGISADEVALIANRRLPQSEALARYYQERRQIPAENLLLVTASTEERIEREEFERDILKPAGKFLTAKGDGRIRLLVTMHGVPLAVRPSKPARDEKEAASVDSELAMLPAGGHALKGWIANPRFVGPRYPDPAMPSAEKTIMVGRLDAASPETVRRMIDDSLAVEREGLAGGVFLDARDRAARTKNADSAYEIYDQLLHRAGALLKRKGFDVTIDDRDEVFAAGSRLPAALYCGWYSLGRYVDAFAWRRGAVGYHLASGECASLRGKNAGQWCRNILEHGAAATIGPVGEPYIQAFPPPDVFFGLLIAGDTLVEAYTGSLPFLSWKMVLLGDPLYRPFKDR